MKNIKVNKQQRSRLVDLLIFTLYSIVSLILISVVGIWAGENSGLHVLKMGFGKVSATVAEGDKVNVNSTVDQNYTAASIGSVQEKGQDNHGENSNNDTVKPRAIQKREISTSPFVINVNEITFDAVEEQQTHDLHTSPIHFEMLDKLASISIAANAPQNATIVRQIKDLEILRIRCDKNRRICNYSDEKLQELKTHIKIHGREVLVGNESQKAREEFTSDVNAAAEFDDLQPLVVRLQRHLYANITSPKPINSRKYVADIQRNSFRSGINTYKSMFNSTNGKDSISSKTITGPNDTK